VDKIVALGSESVDASRCRGSEPRQEGADQARLSRARVEVGQGREARRPRDPVKPSTHSRGAGRRRPAFVFHGVLPGRAVCPLRGRAPRAPFSP
jgi:hypothetical protein